MIWQFHPTTFSPPRELGSPATYFSQQNTVEGVVPPVQAWTHLTVPLALCEQDSSFEGPIGCQLAYYFLSFLYVCVAYFFSLFLLLTLLQVFPSPPFPASTQSSPPFSLAITTPLPVSTDYVHLCSLANLSTFLLYILHSLTMSSRHLKSL